MDADIQNREVIIEAKELSVGFLVTKHGINNFKDFLLTMGIRKLFENKEVLNGFNLKIYKGECFGIMGRNGSGKSTFLRTISGIMKPNSGSITVNGKVAPMMALGVGFEPELTGMENIKLLGTLMGLTRSEIKNSLDAIIEFSELNDYDINSQTKRYSQGMLARLAFSITVAKDPEILIVDEALTVGDLGFKQKCAERIEEIRKNGSTIIYVSHHLEDIRSICKRACFIKDGKVLQVGTIDEISDLYEFEMSKKPSKL
jgi:ABC-type polysaccharide/polyol phosphate transport system ATPase subunit